MEMKVEHNSFNKRPKSMLKVDFRRMFTTRLYYIMVGICLAIPILMLVMTTMTEGSVNVDPDTGVETITEGYENAWQIIGSTSGESSGMSMDLTNMCNINLLYFFAAVFVGLFVSDDFKSGYAKNLFAVRSKKSDYVISKSIVCTICGASMVLAFFIGTILGGSISGLSFDAGTAGISGIIMCVLSKMLLMSALVPIYLLASVIAKQRTGLSLKLLSYPKKTFTRTQLMDEFWDADSNTAPRAVDVYMTKLRDKFSDCREFQIVTVHGLGYKAVIQ